jgi:hypothetical protein
MRAPLAVALCACLPLHAARPLTTEDAEVLDEKACQVEAWIDRSRTDTTGWLVPACNFGASLEWQFGIARVHADGASRLAESYVQVKTAWRASEESPWGIGAVAGLVRHPGHRSHGWDNPFLTFPFTWRLGESSALLHANVGASRDREEGSTVATWGVAFETPASERLTLLGEVFREDQGKPFVRVGARHALVKDRLDIDFTVVVRAGAQRSERLFSLGLAWQLGRLFP